MWRLDAHLLQPALQMWVRLADQCTVELEAQVVHVVKAEDGREEAHVRLRETVTAQEPARTARLVRQQQ